LKAEGRGRGRPKGSADITKLAGVVKEMARLYREMRSGKTDQPEARTGVWILAQMRDTLAVAMIEKRLAELEGAYQLSGDGPRAEMPPIARLHS
jgi:hypothetical protein